MDLRLPDEPAVEPRAPGSPGCDWPWRATYVTYDGKVQPCCMVMGSERAVLGDLGTEDLATVWAGDAYAAVRAKLLGDDPPAVCRGCSVYRGVFRGRKRKRSIRPPASLSCLPGGNSCKP